MGPLKHYLVYQITNTVNGKIYIGKHETYDVDDGYMGSGTILKRAQRKYGLDKFTKEILADFSDPDSMDNMEALLVDEAFVARSDTYNATCGGSGSFYHVNAERAAWTDEQWASFSQRLSDKMIVINRTPEKRASSKQSYQTNLRPWLETHPEQRYTAKGRHHSLEFRQQQAERVRGERNPNFGKHWLFDKEGKRMGMWDGQSPIPVGCFTREQLIEYKDSQLPQCRYNTVHAHRQLRWIHNEQRELYVPATAVDTYVASGWVRGRLRASHH